MKPPLFLLLLLLSSMCSVPHSSINSRTVLEQLIPKWITSDATHSIHNEMGNILFVLALEYHDLWEGIKPYHRDALYNGVLCEFTDNFEDKVNHFLSISDMPAYVIANHKAYAKDPNDKFKMQCTNYGINDCFCKEKRGLLFCLALRLKDKIVASGVRKKKCKNEIIDKLNSSATVLWQNFDATFADDDLILYYLSPSKHSFIISANVTLCEALDPSVEKIVNDLYASDGIFWSSDSYLNPMIEALKLSNGPLLHPPLRLILTTQLSLILTHIGHCSCQRLCCSCSTQYFDFAR